MDQSERRIRSLKLRGSDDTQLLQLRYRLEEAFRTASLPGLPPNAMVLIRRLDLGQNRIRHIVPRGQVDSGFGVDEVRLAALAPPLPVRAIDLNHRYALDGRDPASFGGLLWCFGAFDHHGIGVDRELQRHLSAQDRGVGTISLGKIVQPVGRVTVFGPSPPNARLKLSQYSRADEAPLPVSQYSMMLSSNSSRVRAFSGWPLQSVQAQNFSKIHMP